MKVLRKRYLKQKEQPVEVQKGIIAPGVKTVVD